MAELMSCVRVSSLRCCMALTFSASVGKFHEDEKNRPVGMFYNPEYLPCQWKAERRMRKAENLKEVAHFGL